MNLGIIIKTQRKKLKITAEVLAKKAGIDRTYISKIENYNLIPSWEILTAIERELKIGGLRDLYLEQKYPEVIHDKSVKNYKEITDITQGLASLRGELLGFIKEISPKHSSTIKAFVINLLSKYKPSQIHNNNLIEKIVKRVKKTIKDYQNYQKIYTQEENEIIKLLSS